MTIRKVLGGLIVGLMLIAALLAGYIWVTLHFSYSNGERAGWVQKFSHKGWLVKTWEGELQMVSMPGAAPEKFYFTVRQDGIAPQINALLGKKVALTYEQHKGVPTTLFGETEYFVTGVRVIE